MFRPLLLLLEDVCAKAAKRASPILGKFLKGSTCGDAILGITYLGVINIVTCCANILFHTLNNFRFYNLISRQLCLLQSLLHTP